MGSSKTGGRRERRALSAEFKAEAVRMMTERRTAGTSLAQISRELEVRLDQLATLQQEQVFLKKVAVRSTGERNKADCCY